MSHASIATNLTPRRTATDRTQPTGRDAETEQDRYYDQVMAEAREVVIKSLSARRRHFAKRRRWGWFVL